MRKLLLASAAIGLFTGLTVLAPQKSSAGFYGDIMILVSAMNAVGSKVAAMQSALQGKLQSVQTALNSQLAAGFTQTSNYMKAQVGAQEQIANANNDINLVALRQFRDAHIRDQHVVTPQACDSLTNGQSAVAGQIQTAAITGAIESVTDARSEAGPGTPSYAGIGQGTAAINIVHNEYFCSANDAAAGLCTASQTPDADQHAASLLGASTYAGTSAVDTANDYATMLIQPVAPAAIRGSQLASLSGQSAVVWRRHYNAEMSLARRVTTDVLASHTPSIQLTDVQKQELVSEGKTPVSTASWYEALSLDVNRRESNVSWHAALEEEPKKSVLVEIADELAQSNYIGLANFKLGQNVEMLDAALLADQAQTQLPPPASVPIPNVTAAAN